MPEKIGKLIIKSKLEKTPGGPEQEFFKYVLENVPIQGGENWGQYIYNAKYGKKRYSKIFIDPQNRKLIGKLSETTPWVVLAEFESCERIHL